MLTLRPELIPLSLDGDLRRGGWICDGELRGDTDLISRGQYIQANGRALAGWVDAVARQWFGGHVLAQPDFNFGRYDSEARWQIGTVDNLLAGESIQDISFADVASPGNSHEATSWNFGQVINHILERHCNFIYDADGSNGSPDGVVTQRNVDVTNSTTFDVFIVNQSNNLWQTLQAIGGGEEGGGEFYRIWCDRRNQIIYQPAPPFISPQPAAKGTLTKSHLRGTVEVKFLNSEPGQRIGQVQLTAVANGTTHYNASYPANPDDGKIFQKNSGVWAHSQGRADTLAERLFRWLTRSYTLTVQVDAGLVLFGDDGRGLDLGDRLLVTYNGPAEDADTGAGVHLNLNAASFFVYGVNVDFDAGRRLATASVVLEHDNSA